MRTISARTTLILFCLAAYRQAEQVLANHSVPLATILPTLPAPSLFPRSAQQESLSTYVAHGACPFECCRYGDWQFQTPVTVRRAPDSHSDSVGTLMTGDSAYADSGFVLVHPIGLAVILGPVHPLDEEDSVSLQRGDTVELLDYQGEGYQHVRWHGRILLVSTEQWDSTGRSGARVVREAGEAWWVHVTPRTGRPGWVLMTKVDVLGYDGCG